MCGAGDDMIFGGAGRDQLFGGKGDDVFVLKSRDVGGGTEQVNGGSGRDVAVFALRAAEGRAQARRGDLRARARRPLPGQERRDAAVRSGASKARWTMKAWRTLWRMATFRRVFAVAIVAALAGPGAVASAKTVTAYNIVSPTKLISCWAVLQSTEINCSAPYIPEIGELDTYFALRPRGTTKVAERGDFPGHSTPRRTLRYGDVWVRPGIRCTMRTSGLTCRNRDKHGFHVQRGNTRRF